jgi:hypothetical protein
MKESAAGQLITIQLLADQVAARGGFELRYCNDDPGDISQTVFIVLRDGRSDRAIAESFASELRAAHDSPGTRLVISIYRNSRQSEGPQGRDDRRNRVFREQHPGFEDFYLVRIRLEKESPIS